ncbi:FadR/GntR family transcriptional regulator [Miniphocaeibacter massiliensis]|uniref:FadR/GntR family transcriptional regulator n=1 Tax=Miniphocaeibacter massiliensis TaxID=2041841 RepID=UPI000C08764E|nr:FadR/GntR family transcriptional regulator [Miniphocaeibacter massiliensis]
MKEFSKIKKKLLAEQVEEDLYKYILKSELSIGDKLPNEFELAEKFGVGRSTIREAVKLLESQGVLEVRRGSGTYIVSKSYIEVDPLGLGAIEDKMALAMDLADLRILLEPGIAEIAAINATEKDIKELYELCDIIEEKISKDENYVEEDIKFHTYVAKASKNMVVEQLIPIIDTAVMIFVNVTHKKLIKETIMTHRAVVNAISERDIVGAKTAMMMHMTYNRNLIKEIKKEK